MSCVIRAASLLAALTSAGSAMSSTGQLDVFTANKLEIVAGETVDFYAAFSTSTDIYSNGGNDPVEPLPVEGYQVWQVNWYNVVTESVTNVQLQAAGASYSEPLGGSGGWSFSATFADPGTYVIDLNGGWTTRSESYISTETASRNCYNSDPGGSNLLACDSWQWSYYDNTDTSEYSSQFSPMSLTVQVTAAVPEPATLAMLMAGIGLLGVATVRRRNR